MDAINSISQKIENTNSSTLASSNPICNFKKAIAIEAYQRAGGSNLYRVTQFDTKIIYAVKKWTAKEDVSVEFYTTKGQGEIRVKIITGGTGGKIYDMSLPTFISSSGV